MSCYQNVLLPKCPVTKTSCYRNVCYQNIRYQSVLYQNVMDPTVLPPPLWVGNWHPGQMDSPVLQFQNSYGAGFRPFSTRVTQQVRIQSDTVQSLNGFTWSKARCAT